MTSTINFTDLKQKIALLKVLHNESESIPWENRDEEKQNRYIALRHEIASKLMPLFEDLEETEMLLLWTRSNGATLDTLDNLAVSGENSGIQLVKKD